MGDWHTSGQNVRRGEGMPTRPPNVVAQHCASLWQSDLSSRVGSSIPLHWLIAFEIQSNKCCIFKQFMQSWLPISWKIHHCLWGIETILAWFPQKFAGENDLVKLCFHTYLYGKNFLRLCRDFMIKRFNLGDKAFLYDPTYWKDRGIVFSTNNSYVIW